MFLPVLTGTLPVSLLLFVMNIADMLEWSEAMTMDGGEALFPFAKRPIVSTDVPSLLYQKEKLNWLPRLKI